MNRMHRSVQIREVGDDGRTFTAMAVRYNVEDSYQTIFLPGCFARSLEQHMPRITWAHSWSEVVGKVIAYEDTAEGLIVRARLSDPEAVPRARQAIAQLRDGDVEDVSVGFSPVSTTKVDGLIAFEDAELDEIAVGLVRGAVPGAKVFALRSLESLQPRRVKMISEEDAARIVNATIEKLQSGVVGTDALLAGLQDIKALTVDRPDGDAEPSASDVNESPKVEAADDASAPSGEAETSEESQESEQPAEAPAADQPAQETAELPTEGQEPEPVVEAADEELDALLAEVDAVMTDRDDVWMPDTSSEQVAS